MGKKRIIQQTDEELLKESESIEKGVKKGSESTGSVAPKSQGGRIYIFSSYNNTIISLANANGDVISWVSAGSIGFKGTKKATPFAASKVAEAICLAAQKVKIESVAVFVKGIGSGRESAIRSLATHGLNITVIKDTTPIPHNGCRPPKVRRV
jgi:small subunit ribosomal protein S11